MAARRSSIPGAAAAGFTLIEVLAALVIVSLGMLGVIQAVGQTANNSNYLRDKTLAHWVAMNRLTEARLQAQAPKVDKTSDEVEMAGRKWRWTMVVTQSDVESIRRIDVSVRPSDADEDYSMATVTGFFGSAVAPPGSTLVLWQGSPTPGGDPGRAGRPVDQPPPPPGEGDKPPPPADPVDPDNPPVTPREFVE